MRNLFTVKNIYLPRISFWLAVFAFISVITIMTAMSGVPDNMFYVAYFLSMFTISSFILMVFFYCFGKRDDYSAISKALAAGLMIPLAILINEAIPAVFILIMLPTAYLMLIFSFYFSMKDIGWDKRDIVNKGCNALLITSCFSILISSFLLYLAFYEFKGSSSFALFLSSVLSFVISAWLMCVRLIRGEYHSESRNMRVTGGFTLFLQICVFTILLSSLFVPNLLGAIVRGKQKRTMADIRTIGTMFEMYKIDKLHYPTGRGNIENLEKEFIPEYIQQLPLEDGWGNPNQFISDGESYTVFSTGKDKKLDYNWGGGSTQLFDNDIVFSNEKFYQWPDGPQE